MEHYVCVKPLWVQNYDDDGFIVENAYMDIAVGEVWTVEKQEYNLVASNDAIHLERNLAWIEIHQDTLDAHFELVKEKL